MDMREDTASHTGYGEEIAEIYDKLYPSYTSDSPEMQWLLEQSVRSSSAVVEGSPKIVEFGVGTARILSPLSDLVASQYPGAPPLLGIDLSASMLARAKQPQTGTVSLRLGDMREPIHEIEHDLVLCLCASLSMLVGPESRYRAFKSFARTMRPEGTLIVETHNSSIVKSISNGPPLCVPLPGKQNALVMFSTLSGMDFLVNSVWIEKERLVRFTESGELIEEQMLLAAAEAAGLERTERCGSLAGTPFFADTSPTAIDVFRVRT